MKWITSQEGFLINLEKIYRIEREDHRIVGYRDNNAKLPIVFIFVQTDDDGYCSLANKWLDRAEEEFICYLKNPSESIFSFMKYDPAAQ